MNSEKVHTLNIETDFPSPQFEIRPVDATVWRNGMLVRMPNHLGDAVMALPALKQLRTIVPEGCGLYVLAPKNQNYLYRNLSIIDGMILLEKCHTLWDKESFSKVRKMRFGAGVLFNNSLRDTILMRLAGVRHLYGAARRGRSILLTRSFKFPPRPTGRAEEIHQSNKLLAMVTAMGAAPWDGKMPEFSNEPPFDELATPIAVLCSHPKLLTLASGAAYGAAKRWPAENFRKVAEYWIAQGGVAAVLGSPSEAGIGDEVLAGLNPDKAFNLSGKTNLGDVMQLLRASRLTVANDSGIMHLAAGMGTPGIAVFGPTDYTATGPVSTKWRLMYDKVPCSPCFARSCPKQPLCEGICAITPEMVIAEIEKMQQ
ncbi:MAG: lipopolysaccharide heptosyltransferase II [Lentisphaeria bacterium]|nr:lipopolysaccharide heptosyltransferase II [Lentisphaeria bacterium]